MIVLKSREEVEKIRRAAMIAANAVALVGRSLRDGIATIELERIATDYILSHDARPSFPMVRGYHHTLCVAINEEVVHGIPGPRRLKEGDLISVDCGAFLEGFHGDHAWTFPVGNVSEDRLLLLKTGEEALMRGITAARVGNRLYDIGAAIESCAKEAGYSVVRDYVGHGIGVKLHEEPQVPNYGEAGTGIKLRRGLVLALEPMLNAGTHEVEVLTDGWTVVTKDRKPSVHFEHTVAIMENGPEILSLA